MNIIAILFIKISIERKKYLFGLCVKKSNFLMKTVLFLSGNYIIFILYRVLRRWNMQFSNICDVIHEYISLLNNGRGDFQCIFNIIILIIINYYLLQ